MSPVVRKESVRPKTLQAEYSRIRVRDDLQSSYSDVYTDVNVDTWSADWDVADVEDVVIGGDNMKRYSNLSFAGITFESGPIDASSMTNFRMDIWTPDDIGGGVFRIKLVTSARMAS